MNTFPPNPKHGDIFEYKTGLLYQYDAGVNGWIPVVSNSSNLELATPIKNGAMSSVDLRKLNRLVLPFPKSSIIGNDCEFAFDRGQINLSSGDDFVGVEGLVKVTNVDELGDSIEKSIDFQIHQHTYGFDFTLNLPNLVEELLRLGQIKVQGSTGPKGDKGVKGDNGLNVIVSGPPGDKGVPGDAPECELTVETEPISVNPKFGLDKAFVDVRIKDHPTDRFQYYLEFDRQSIGDENRSANRLNVGQFSSYWVLAVTSSTAGNKQIYYLDVEPILSSIKDKFMEQVELLKAGYESITKHWVQTMSDLFDEQKAALCCALENCISKTKSVDTRRHMETTAAAVIPDGKININVFPPKGTPKGDVNEVSHTRLTPKNDCYKPPTSQDAQVNSLIKVDATTHVASAKNAQKLTLPSGKYAITVSDMSVKIDDQYGSMIKVQHVNQGANKVSSILDKGRYNELSDAKSAYENLSLVIDHDGGEVAFFFPAYIANSMTGDATLEISAIMDPQMVIVPHNDEDTLEEKHHLKDQQADQQFYCSMTSSHLNWYKSGWEHGLCCGMVVNVAGQEYIIVKRGIGIDDACGGGESDSTSCVGESLKHFKHHPAFAWPTLNGRDFAPIPDGDIAFKYDEEMNIVVHERMGLNDYREAKGSPNTYRHLAYQLGLVLFPVNNG